MSNISQDAGHGKITAQIHSNQVVFPVLAYTYPLKLLSPRMQQECVSIVYMMTYGGGLVGGDRISLSINVEHDVRLVLLSQGSTKVFKTRSGTRASVRSAPSTPNDPTTTQCLDVSIAAGGALFLLPDPVTCFRDAAYHQAQTFRLAHGASAALLDWYTSGRRARGEEWAFAKYYSANEVFVGGVRTARDVVLLNGALAGGGGGDGGDGGGGGGGGGGGVDLRGRSLPRHTLADRMGPYACYATLLLYGPLVQGVVRELEERVREISVFRVREPPDVLWSMSGVRGEAEGRVVRVAGKETEDVKKWLCASLRGLVDIVGTEVYSKAFV